MSAQPPAEGAVLAVWRTSTVQGSRAVVIPDGCRDVILRVMPDGGRTCFLTNLDDRARCVEIAPGEALTGIRFRPGATVDERRLLAVCAEGRGPAVLMGLALECSHVPAAIAEALAALAEPGTTLRRVASAQGVGLRTLQRHLERATGRPPRFWLHLARARQAGRLVTVGEVPLAEVACIAGYADQAHMTRALKAWFGLPPGALRRDPATCRRLGESGYG